MNVTATLLQLVNYVRYVLEPALHSVLLSRSLGPRPGASSHGSFAYHQMYGQYSKELGDFAKSESKRLRELEKKRKREERLRRQELLPYRGKWNRRVLKVLGYVWKHTFARIGEDWVFLAILGVLMACISFVMDYGIAICNKGECCPDERGPVVLC